MKIKFCFDSDPVEKGWYYKKRAEARKCNVVKGGFYRLSRFVDIWGFSFFGAKCAITVLKKFQSYKIKCVSY